MEYGDKFLKSWRNATRIENLWMIPCLRNSSWLFIRNYHSRYCRRCDSAAILRFNGGSYCNFCLVQSKCQFHPASGVIGSLCTRPSEESRNFHVNFLFFSWPHVTVRATLARVDDTALAAIDRDGWNAKLGRGEGLICAEDLALPARRASLVSKLSYYAHVFARSIHLFIKIF